jgi:RES domain-containing protein
VTFRAWRIVQAGLAAGAFSGEGARQYGGRWNHKGVPMVYTAASVSLAALEMLVHLDSARFLDCFVCIPVDFDDSRCRKINVSVLPENWNTHPPSPATRDIGSEWIRSGSSPVLAVPSVPVALETDYLLNPAHPDFPKLRIGTAQSFQYDRRLVGPE